MSQQDTTWSTLFDAAHRGPRIGDLLLLAGEAPSTKQKVAAHRTAALALIEEGHYSFARAQLEAALELDPTDSASRQHLATLSELSTVRAERHRQPRLILLFTGHMIDKKGRTEPRFPASKGPIASEAIARVIETLGADSEDLAICGGACGGDLLFAKACHTRGLRLELYLPQPEAAFLADSVGFEKALPEHAQDTWIARYFEVKRHRLTQTRFTPDDVGPAPQGVDSYARNNLRQLYTAFSYGPEKVHVLALWNGKGGDGPGGTADMIQKAMALGAKTHIINTNEVFGIGFS